MPSPLSTPADFTDKSDRGDTEKENNHDSVFGVRLHLFKPSASGASAFSLDEKLEKPPVTKVTKILKIFSNEKKSGF